MSIIIIIRYCTRRNMTFYIEGPSQNFSRNDAAREASSTSVSPCWGVPEQPRSGWFMVAATVAPLNPFKVLGVSASASASEIRAAWRRLVLSSHPDKVGDDGSAFRRVQLAYEMLRENSASFNTKSTAASWGTPEDRAQSWARQQASKRREYEWSRPRQWSDRQQARHDQRYRTRYETYVQKKQAEQEQQRQRKENPHEPEWHELSPWQRYQQQKLMREQQEQQRREQRQRRRGRSATSAERGKKSSREDEVEVDDPQTPETTHRSSTDSSSSFQSSIQIGGGQTGVQAQAQAETVQADLPDSATPTAPHPPTPSLPSSPSPAHALPAHGPGRVCYFSTRTKWHLVYHTDRCCSGLRLYGNKQIFVDMARPEGLDPCSRCVPMQHCREPDVSVENASAAVAEAARGAEAVHTCTPAFTRAVHTSSGGAEAVQSMYEA